MFYRYRRWRRLLGVLLPPLLFVLLALYAMWPWLPFAGAAQEPQTIIFYGFSITGSVLNDAIFPAFQARWEAQTGERVAFISAFAGSGTITNQLIMGVPADVALLALELDAERLSEAGLIPAEGWKSLPSAGVVNRSPFVILVRPGNPQNIQSFVDLGRPGIGVVHPDPLTSGAASWAILAEYGAGVRAADGDPAGGVTLLANIWRNVVAQAASARAARTQFENGFGDALITYEQDVRLDVQRGALAGEIVYPPSTIMSEHIIVVLDHNVAPDEVEVVRAFVDYLWSDEAQRLFVEYGFRSVNEVINAHSSDTVTIADPFYVSEFGGWKQAKAEIVDEIWREGVLEELGR